MGCVDEQREGDLAQPCEESRHEERGVKASGKRIHWKDNVP